MDDPDAFCQTLARHLDETSSKLAAYLSRHSAILTEDARNLLAHAKDCATRGTFGNVPGANSPNELAVECFDKLKSAEAILLARVRSQASDVA